MKKLSVPKGFRRSWQKNRYELKGLFDGGLPRFVLFARPRELGAGVPVFCYHTVTHDELFQDLQFLQRNGYTSLSGDDLLRHVRGECAAPARSLVLTFDDGARNFHQVAFPLLKRFQMRSMVFIAPGMHFEEPPPGFEATQERPMTWSELREVHACGLVDIESHTYESRYMPRWPQPQALSGVDGRLEATLRRTAMPLEEDLREAKLLLETQLSNKVVRHLAFPAYDGTEEALAAAARCGYAACHWGILPGRPVNRPGASPMHIARVSHEYLRRLPGKDRSSLPSLVLGRARIVRAAWFSPAPLRQLPKNLRSSRWQRFAPVRAARAFIARALLALGFDLRLKSDNRHVLEQTIFPYFVDRQEFRKILFVGCDWYTHAYRRIFRHKDYVTIEIDPRRTHFGATRHIVDSVTNVARHFSPGELDVIFCNGVFGSGLDSRDEVSTAFAGCYTALRSGGVFVLGWDDVPEKRPFPPDEVSELQAFSRWTFPPLTTSRYVVEPDRHVYDFFRKP